MRLVRRFTDSPLEVLFLAWLAAGCAAGDPPAASEAPGPGPLSVSQPIVAGTPVTGDPAIMALLSFQGNRGARCTATLITPRLLIAAAHCIVETPGFERQIFPGNEDRNGAAPERLAVKEVVSHPLYRGPRQGNDFCIVVLEAPVSIPPVRLNRAPVESAQGKTVRYVGYGLAMVGNPNSGGVKRQNTEPLAQVSRLLLTIAPNANQSCEGDSGGPLLLDDGQGEAIIGINSFVDAPACRRNSFFQRVDTQIAWIDEQIQKYDPASSPAPGDGGASDAAPAAPVPPPDAGAPESAPPAPVPPPDAGAPDTGAPAMPPPLPPDAGAASAPGAPDVPPGLEPSRAAGDSAGGCRYSAGAPPASDAGAAALAGVLLALAWSARRRRGR